MSSQVTIAFEDMEIIADFWASEEDDCQLQDYECFKGDEVVVLDDALRTRVEARLETYAYENAYEMWMDSQICAADAAMDRMRDEGL